jgi:hypothetical protein
MKILKGLLLLIILFILASTLIQVKYHPFRVRALNGTFRLNEKPDFKRFTWDRWFSGFFQAEFTGRVEDHTPLRNTLVRIYNQYDYSVFDTIHTVGYVMGKNRILFNGNDLLEYSGKYYIGENAIFKKMKKLREVHDTLAKKNTLLLFVLEPSKCRFYHDYLPVNYLPGPNDRSNFGTCLDVLKKTGLPFLDLDGFLLRVKDTSRVPLFTNYGMKLTPAGLAYSIDTLAGYIRDEKKGKVPQVLLRDQKIPDSLESLLFADDNVLNLLCPGTGGNDAYPFVEFSRDPSAKKLSVLVIGGDYFRTVGPLISAGLFRHQEFWYRNQKPTSGDGTMNPVGDNLPLAGKLSKFDVILVMISEKELHTGIWNFPDEAYAAFFPKYVEDPVFVTENSIRANPEWFDVVAEKAFSHHYTLEEMIRTDAEYICSLQKKP